MEQLEVLRELGATGSTTVLRLKGPLTLATVHTLQQAFGEIGDVDTVVDVSKVPYIDSGGLGAILGRWSQTQKTLNKFALTGTHARIDLLLDITRVNTVMPIFRTADEADRSFMGKAATA
jgi:anti-sigma B factor antagonist